MEPIEYQRMRDFESWYWWYQAQRDLLRGVLGRLRLPHSARVLDAGCGTGHALADVAAPLGLEGYGVDISADAARWWTDHLEVHRGRASVNLLPFRDGSFDAVFTLDVIGCQGVDTEQAVAEMARTVRPGGYLIIFAPAYQWLRSRHDVAVHSVRRFTRGELSRMVRAAGLRVASASHRFALFFPLIAAWRLVTRRSAAHADTVRSDLRPLPRWLNQALLAAANFEHRLLRDVRVPVGSTIELVARKPA